MSNDKLSTQWLVKFKWPLVTDWETFLNAFIFNQHQSAILDEYKLWLADLKELELGPFHQWINGSFISKKPTPNDLDVVTFIQAQAYEEKEIQFRNISKKLKNIDCYWVKDYPVGHSKHFVTQFDKVEWLSLFSTDRMRNQKGFIQLNF